MKKEIFFKKEISEKEYFEFIDYAFSKADYFMMVYGSAPNYGYTYHEKRFKKALEKFKVKSRTGTDCPGLYEFNHEAKYKIVFYKTSLEAREIFKEISKEVVGTYNSSGYHRHGLGLFLANLSFFKKDDCWFYSSMEEEAVIIEADKSDIKFALENGLAAPEDIIVDNEKKFYCYHKEPGLT